MNLVIKHASSLLLLVLKWNLVDVPRDDHGKEKENTQFFFFFKPTLWTCGLQGTFVLAIGDCHAMNRLPRSCSQATFQLAGFMAGFWDLN